MDQVTGSWIRRLDHESEDSIIPPGVMFPDDAEELLGPDIIRFLAPETGRTVPTLH